MSELRRFVTPSGLTLAGDVGGDPAAPPVILLHGGGQTRHSWSRAMQALEADGYHVINLDARGHGESDWSPDGDYRFTMMAEDLRAVIASLPRRPALVGASMGGIVSLLGFGQSSTPIAEALVLVDIVPQADREGVERVRGFMRARPDGFATLEEAVEAVAAYNPHRPRPRDPAGLLKNLRQRDGRYFWHWDPKLIAHLDGNDPHEFLDLLHGAAARVTVPTLLVRGLRSDIVNDDGVAALRAHLPHLEVADIAEAGHMVAGDRNDVFNHSVLAFLHRHLPVR